MKYYRFLPIAFASFLLVLSQLVSAQSADQERLERIVSTLASDDFLGRGFGSHGGDRAEAFIIEEFIKSGIEPFNGHYKHIFNHRSGILNVEGANIVGIVRGSDPQLADEYVIIGAHYDHVGWEYSDDRTDTIVYNGADDNASGVAAITEIGRMLKEQQSELGRSVIIIAFDGEESGLLGSKAFVRDFITADDAMIDTADVKAMFSLDMVGMYDTHGGVDLPGIEMLKDYKELINISEAETPIEITKTNDQLPKRTDTAPFGKIGIPATHVFTGTESPYHKPEDDADLLEYEGMKIVTDFVAVLVKTISVSAEIEKTKLLEVIEEKGSAMKIFNPGVILNLGGSHFDDLNDYRKAKPVFSSGVGFMLETRIAQWLAIQPEVLYEFSGSQYVGGNLRTHSVTVPVSILLTTPDPGGNGFRAYYQVGGYYSYAFAGKHQGDNLNFQTLEERNIFDESDVPADFDPPYNGQDYGFIFGAGMEIMNFRMGYVFQSSLVDFTTNLPFINSIQADTRLKGSYLRIGWTF